MPTDRGFPRTGAPHVLLVNPWIHDFAAYDFWAKPLGLLSLAGILRAHGVRVSYIDCLDRFHPRMPPGALETRQGRGPYRKTPIARPPGLASIPRTYSRYGIAPEWFCEDLLRLTPPDLVLVTSLMTYWYPGVVETIREIRGAYPKVPVILGGIYATLCADHAARVTGADRVITGPAEALILDIVREYTGYAPAPVMDPEDLDTWPYPALDLQHGIGYVPLLTSRGCPFDCAYCASRQLNPERRTRSPRRVVDEIRYWHENWAVRDFAFYDDALLMDAERHILPILDAVIAEKRPLRFHTPNALHIRNITPRLADRMFRAGFHTVRLGLETMAFGSRRTLDEKVDEKEFFSAVTRLLAAGFRPEQIGAYLLAGLPGQSREAVEMSIRMVRKLGIRPVPAHYTPIPGTRLWEAACAASRYDLAKDPIYTNNAIVPCQKEEFSWNALARIKALAAGAYGSETA